MEDGERLIINPISITPNGGRGVRILSPKIVRGFWGYCFKGKLPSVFYHISPLSHPRAFFSAVVSAATVGTVTLTVVVAITITGVAAVDGWNFCLGCLRVV